MDLYTDQLPDINPSSSLIHQSSECLHRLDIVQNLKNVSLPRLDDVSEVYDVISTLYELMFYSRTTFRGSGGKIFSSSK